MEFICYVSFPQSFLAFHGFDTLKASYFVDGTSIWICLIFPHTRFWLFIFGKNITAVILCSSHCLFLIVCKFNFLTANDINFDHLIKMGSASFVNCKVTIFPFVTN